jgi:serine/threonine protein kinase
VLNIFYQSIELLEIVHKSGYIHCDLKPENLMLGLKGDYKTVYLIDFSLAEKYTDQDGEPLEEPAHSVFKGSISFWSRKVLNGSYPSLIDDIESLLYTIMYLLKPLPWLPPQNMKFEDSKEKKDYVISRKKKLKTKEIFIGFPSVFAKVYDHIKTVGYSEMPDYGIIKTLLR